MLYVENMCIITGWQGLTRNLKLGIEPNQINQQTSSNVVKSITCNISFKTFYLLEKIFRCVLIYEPIFNHMNEFNEWSWHFFAI